MREGLLPRGEERDSSMSEEIEMTCEYCLTKLIPHPNAGTISDGKSGYEYLCPNCGAGWNILARPTDFRKAASK